MRRLVTIMMIAIMMTVTNVAQGAAGISLKINGETVKGAPPSVIKNQRVYLPVRFVVEPLGASVNWNQADHSVEIVLNQNRILLNIGSNIAYVNGAEIQLEEAVFVLNNRTYVPVRFIAETLGMRVDWHQAIRSVAISPPQAPVSMEKFISSDEELRWLAQIIEAEASGESLEGKIAVGAVILNRVKSNQFPNSIKEVIFDRSDGYYQFTPVQNKYIYSVKPSQETYLAVERVLQGEDPTNGALYFYNPKANNSKWMLSRKVVKVIGNHIFAV